MKELSITLNGREIGIVKTEFGEATIFLGDSHEEPGARPIATVKASPEEAGRWGAAMINALHAIEREAFENGRRSGRFTGKQSGEYTRSLTLAEREPQQVKPSVMDHNREHFGQIAYAEHVACAAEDATLASWGTWQTLDEAEREYWRRIGTATARAGMESIVRVFVEDLGRKNPKPQRPTLGDLIRARDHAKAKS